MKQLNDLDRSTPIAITGATGMQGAYLCRALNDAGFENITALKRRDSDTALPDSLNAKIEWTEGDMTEVESLYSLTESKSFVFHCAAYVSFNPSRKDEIFKVNINGTADLVNACLENGVKKFIHCSSVAAMGRPVVRQSEVDEEVEWNRTKTAGAYALSKYYSEMEVWRAHAEGLPISIVNPSVILGGGFWNKGSARLHLTMDRGVPFYPMGSGGFVDARDVADLMIRLMDPSIDGERFICSAENQSYKHVLSRISNLLGKKPPSRPIKNWMISTLPFAMGLARKLGLKAPQLTSDMLKASSEQVKYSNKKSLGIPGFEYRPLEETLTELTEVYRKAKETNSPFGLLKP